MRGIKKLSIFIATICLCQGLALAGAVLSPVAASASLPTETTYPDCTIGKTIDQSGLVTPFISGVTEYSSYMAGDPKHEAMYQDGCYLSENVYFALGVKLTYDLGASYEVEHVVIWNGAVNSQNTDAGIKDAVLYFSEFEDFSIATSLGVVVPQVADASIPFSAYVLDLRNTITARYIRIDVSTNYGNTGHYCVSEVAFGVVPEPATVLLMGLGITGLLRKSRRLSL